MIFPEKKHKILMELVKNIIDPDNAQNKNHKYGTDVGIYVKYWLNVLIK